MLDFTLMKYLAFRDHIDHVVKKQQLLRFIYHVRHLYPRKCLFMFYNSFAESIMTYEIDNDVWSTYLRKISEFKLSKHR